LLVLKALGEFLPTLRTPFFGKEEINKHIELAKQLYRALVAPALDLIRGKHHIVIVPDADLYYLPFETLIASDEKAAGSGGSLAAQSYLGKAYTFSYAPSSSVLVTRAECLEEPSQPVGEPRLCWHLAILWGQG
jgi:hypothetical protein